MQCKRPEAGFETSVSAQNGLTVLERDPETLCNRLIGYDALVHIEAGHQSGIVSDRVEALVGKRQSERKRCIVERMA